jgi:pimeloyl-ACP methyl ester carboxylesterase
MALKYRVIRPDLPGLGHSRVPRGFDYSLATLARFVTQVMDKADIESAHIIGAKTGGAVAMRMAADDRPRPVARGCRRAGIAVDDRGSVAHPTT